MAHKGRLPSSCPELTTLLFDLDGTLVDMQKKGLQVRLMAKAVLRYARAVRPWSFPSAFWAAIKGLQCHGTPRTNHDVFLDHLMRHASCTREELDALCEEFVALDVSTASDQFSPVPGARETLLRARELGFDLVVATNPVFPLSAVKLRLRWGGVDDVPFTRITSSQSMTRCKPDPDYYRELLGQLGVDGARCLMIGNDPKKDLPAKDVGCKTWILDTPEVRPKEAQLLSDPRLDAYGSYEDLTTFLERSRGDRRE
jgi:FMN phosphatase YigB (HAD superfamily)